MCASAWVFSAASTDALEPYTLCWYECVLMVYWVGMIVRNQIEDIKGQSWVLDTTRCPVRRSYAKNLAFQP